MENNCNMSQEGILKNFEKGLLSEKRAMSLCQELLLLVEGEEEKDDLKVNYCR